MPAMRTLLATLLTLAAAASELAAQDVIKFKDPKNDDMDGTIATMSYKLVEIERNIGGTLTKQPADARQIAELIPSNSTKTFDFAEGERLMANENYQVAIQRFDRVSLDQRASELQKQLAAINVVRCNYYASNAQGVITSAQSMRSKKPESFYIRESFELEVKAQLALKNQTGATSAINAFAALGNSNGMQEWSKSADLMQAGLAELKGDWRGALTIHRKYIRDHDVGDDATLGEMRCLTALSDWTSLNSRADAIIQEAKGKKGFSTRLLIAAYNGKGDSESNGGKVKEALLDYLQGAVVLSKGETSPEHEAALARSSVACAKLASAEKDKTKKDTYRGRAQEMLGELVRTYPTSKLRPEAERAIKDVK